MTAEKAALHTRVAAFLSQRLANRSDYAAYLAGLWDRFLALDLASEHFVNEFTAGSSSRLVQRAWEMQLACHLDALGHRIKSPAQGPDFGFEHQGVTIWVEAISPEPTGLPADWMNTPASGQFTVGTFPHEEILLRWTAAYKEKIKKLARYRAVGIVSSADAYVIAVNGCQFGAFLTEYGISTLPLPIETVFPVGPLALRVDRDTRRVKGATVTERFNIKSRNGSPVPTTSFVNPAHGSVSALIGFARDRFDGVSLPLRIVHNPLAQVRVATGVLTTEGEEWIASPLGSTLSEFMLEQSSPARTSRPI